jgi:hypothetical protein
VKLRVTNILSTPRALRELSHRLDAADLGSLRAQKLTPREFLDL